MPTKKKKYNARFPPARIKKIMQTDEDVGKVAAAVPVIISRALELFIDTLIEKTATITQSKNAKTLSSSHVKQAIHSEKTFDFLRDLVKNVPDHQVEEDIDTPMSSCSSYTEKIEKKPKVQRQKKPREEGAKGPGRPKKAKVEQKKDLASEVPDEEVDTDEDQTQEEDSNDQSSFPDSTPVPNEVTIHTPIAAELEERPVAHKMALPREQTDNVQYVSQNQSVVRSLQPFKNVHAGFPMHNLSFQQYPCSGAVPMISNPFISQQQNILPNSPFTMQGISSFAPHFVSTTPSGFVMSSLLGSQQLNLSQLSTPGLHQGSLPSMVPTTPSLSNSVTNNCDTSMPLSMSVDEKVRSPEVDDYSSIHIMMPMLQRMPPIVLHGPQLGTIQNSQSNFTFEQNMAQAVTQSQGQLSSNKNQTVECAAENGKHKTYESLRSPINNKSSENPFNIHISSEQNKAQLSAIANIMNTKSLDAADKDMDDDYDS